MTTSTREWWNAASLVPPGRTIASGRVTNTSAIELPIKRAIVKMIHTTVAAKYEQDGFARGLSHSWPGTSCGDRARTTMLFACLVKLKATSGRDRDANRTAERDRGRLILFNRDLSS